MKDLNTDQTGHETSLFEEIKGDISDNGVIDLVDFIKLAQKWKDTNCDSGNSYCGNSHATPLKKISARHLLRNNSFLDFPLHFLH